MTANDRELLNLSLAKASELVQKRDLSPVDLVDACLRRIEATNDRLKAYITHYDQAREVAKAAETMVAADHWLGPLHGIPLAVKDNIGLRGLRSTAGSKILAEWIPEED